MYADHGLLVSGGRLFPCYLELWRKDDNAWVGRVSNINVALMITTNQLYEVCTFIIGRTRQQDGKPFYQCVEGLEINLLDLSADSVGVTLRSEPEIALVAMDGSHAIL